MADIKRIEDYAGFMSAAISGMYSKLSEVRGDYMEMLEDGAFLVDVDIVLDGVEESMDTIGKELCSIMRCVSLFKANLKEEKGETDGKEEES